jgi:hypothetical protein
VITWNVVGKHQLVNSVTEQWLLFSGFQVRDVFWKVDQDLSSDPALCRELNAHQQAAAGREGEEKQLSPLCPSSSTRASSSRGLTSSCTAPGLAGLTVTSSASTAAGSRAGSQGDSVAPPPAAAAAATATTSGEALECSDGAALAKEMGPLADKLSVAIEVMYLEWRKAVDGGNAARGAMYRLKDELRDAVKGETEAKDQCTLLENCLEELRQQLLQSKVLLMLFV